ncbi:hypothetical protein A1O3_09213 [Capronia epimyces CBS 606.96]|uniref:Uncharacterized protein n=1 Tax=Capronia epimyces CBS 606.96 TaxID=1182542 RepID=W9XC41_9EURO|nr:uncharacterized protein A1O3_09213 [Capronia epimyces CBS 606.96]EXJ78052.1 hypothetical protein A1O3_09213 [Capronia epimyces CBS 606.96]
MMAPRGGTRLASGRDVHKSQRNGNSWESFAAPPLARRPKLFCCSVAESNPDHLPRSFVNPGRHLMNLQLRTFLECADNAEYTFSKCEVSHIVEVTTRALHNPSVLSSHDPFQEQWNVPSGMPFGLSMSTNTPPLEEDEDSGMIVDEEAANSEIPYSTYQSLLTRHFVTQNSNNAWQIPPHSRQYRETHGELAQGRAGSERYIEIAPFKTLPYTSESSSGGSSGGAGARTWVPSCSMLMWCTQHNTFYEVHVLS